MLLGLKSPTYPVELLLLRATTQPFMVLAGVGEVGDLSSGGKRFRRAHDHRLMIAGNMMLPMPSLALAVTLQAGLGIVTFASEDWAVRGQLSARELMLGRKRHSGSYERRRSLRAVC